MTPTASGTRGHPPAGVAWWAWVLGPVAVLVVLVGVLGAWSSARLARDEWLDQLDTIARLKAQALGGADLDALAEPARSAARELLLAVPASAGEAQVELSRQGASLPLASTERVYSHAVPVPGSDWQLRIAYPRARVEGDALAHAGWVLAVDGLVLALGAGAAGLWVQRQRMRRLREDRRSARERLQALQLLDGLCHATPDLVYAFDTRGRCLFANPRVRAQAPGPTDTAEGLPVEQVLPPALARRWREALDGLRRGVDTVQGETRLDAPGGERWLLDTFGPLRDAQGQLIGVFGMSRDITERRRADDTRRQWAMAFENTRDGVIITSADATILAVNRAFSDITGYAAAAVVGRTPAMLSSGRQDGSFYAEMWSQLRRQGHWQGEIWNRRCNGEVYPEWLTISAVRDDAGGVQNYVGVFTDISRIKRSEAELERLARYDPLTGLPNRLQLQDTLERAMERRGRVGGRLAVLYIDLDGFKTVNDSLGHPAGDELLVRMAARLRGRLREGDTLGRLGGDEFLVLLESVADTDEVVMVAQSLLRAVGEPLRLAGGREAYVTASIGVSLHPDDRGATAVELLRDADAAMFRAKDDGRNRFRFYTGDLHAEAMARLDMEAALSRALGRGEFSLHYQPKVHAVDGRLAGVEALLRWERPGGEMVSPAVFVPLAERMGLIHAIGGWVIDEACRQIRAWLDAGLPAPQVAVNVSARQFAAGDLPDVLAAALQRHGVPPRCLQVELTESALVDRAGEAETALRRIRSLGVCVALDDFGTGYSSLGYLHRFPIDTLKIDRAFVHRIELGAEGAALVDGIIALAHRLQLHVVAEGVETAEQAEHLRGQGCDELQGWYFGRPMPAAALQAVMQAGAIRPLPAGEEPALAI
ncbi:putative bifunctional diguanylate cyclase/phosphodiesterase [Ideonella sp.]|uniref:putative bifunctional diguanylate cyclase/phosphodiesterase n=1 Tax=Ideonella sp. TaxID=1929293 RepID=UPI0035B33A7E